MAMTTAPMPDARYATQALARLTDEVDRLSGKIDKLGELMATKRDLARYAPRETVEARMSDFERRASEVQSHVERHDAQLAGLLRENMAREVRWDWRVIGGLGCVMMFVFSLLGTILSGTLVGIIVWTLTHR
jgi:Flp pilus assembly protein TadB